MDLCKRGILIQWRKVYENFKKKNDYGKQKC